mgnify:CR=1 FL=1
MYICNRFFLCMTILRGRKRFFYKDSLVVFTHKFVNLRRKKVSEKDAFFFCYAARLLSIFIFKISLVFSIITFREVILQK